jgi:predicted ATPase
MCAYLLLHRTVAQSRQHLAYLFWPDSSDAQARTNLRNALFHLRNALPESAALLQIETQTARWRPDGPFTLDVALFEQALHNAQKAGEPNATRAQLTQAIATYVGDLLPGCYDEWILPLRDQLRERYHQALEQLMALLESQQDYRLAIEVGQRLLQQDPLRETTYVRLMQLYALAGDRAAALRTYHTCSTALARELGVDPDPATHSVYEHILNLEAPQPVVSHVRDASPLIGREHAWAQLQESWRQAVRGAAKFFLVAGEAGIGKTRLVEEMVEWARRQGIAAAVSHCYASGGNLALAPVQEWLRTPLLRRASQTLEPFWASEVARLLPELLTERPQLAAPEPMTEAWQRQRLFEALSRLVLWRKEPLLLFIDDVQWSDRDTLEWVQHLLQANPQARLLVIGALRQESLTPEHPLSAFLVHLRRVGQLQEVELARLNPNETARLVENLLGRTLEPEGAQRIFAESEGNPLFVVEIMRASLSNPRPAPPRSTYPTAGSASTPADLELLPPKVLSVIQSRLLQLSPQALELAGVAAVIGRAFTVNILAQASDNDEDSLVRGLDELWRQRMIREQAGRTPGGETYDFSHDKLRDVVYASLSPIRRRFLHRRVAQALETAHRDHLDAVNAQIASHYEHAGQGARAIDAYRRAAQVAYQRSAFHEAIGLLRHALNLLADQPASLERDQQELRIQSTLGPLLLATLGYAAPEVEQAFQRAWALCQPTASAKAHPATALPPTPFSLQSETPNSDLAQRFQVLWGLGRFYLVKPDPERGMEASQQLLALAEATNDMGLLIEAWCSLGTHYFHRAAFQEARRYLELTLAHYEPPLHRSHAQRYGQDPIVVGSAYLAWTLWCLGESQAALTQAASALRYAQTLEHPYSHSIALAYGCVQQQFLEDPTGCLEQTAKTIALTTQYGFTLWLSTATFLAGWAKSEQGDFDNGLADMQKGIDLFRSTGAELGAAYFAALLATTIGRESQPDIGLLVINEAFNLLERAQDQWCAAELHRLHGELLLRNGESIAAESALQTALTIAGNQQARQWELRAAISLGRLWQSQNKWAETQALLAPLVAWFPADAPTPDLAAACMLIADQG